MKLLLIFALLVGCAIVYFAYAFFVIKMIRRKRCGNKVMLMPDLMFFCEQGHMVSASNETERLEVYQLNPCPVCGSQHLRAVINWPAENTDIVPEELIKPEEDEPVFDVRLLFEDDKKAAWVVHLDQFKRN